MWNDWPYAILWKNGEPQSLDHSPFSTLVAVFASGGDVYAAGGQTIDLVEHTHDVRVWKNGVSQPQRLSYDAINADVNSLVVSNGDVYVAGWERNAQGLLIATLWKNGEPQRIGNGLEQSRAHSLCVSDGDVYFCVSQPDTYQNDDYQGSHQIWKNGQMLFTIKPNQGETGVIVTSLFVSDGDVYAVGDVGGPWIKYN
jgi:hypothetical protein